MPVEWQGHKITVLDTPGYVDFMGEVYSAIVAVDALLLVIDAVSGVEVGTELAWQIAREYDVPVIVCVNKMARENAAMEVAPGQPAHVAGSAISCQSSCPLARRLGSTVW